MNSSKLLLGFLAGAAIGGALGILLAPDKGAETRRKIIEKGNDFTDTVKDKFGDIVDGVRENFSKTKGETKSSMS